MNFKLKNIFLPLVFLLIIHSFTFAQKRDGKKKDEPTISQLQEAEAYFTEGMKFYMMEDYEKAIPPYQKALEITPNNGGIFYASSYWLSKI